MTEVKAQLSNLRMSAKKVRLVADLVRGMKTAEAIDLLKFTNKAAARPLRKLLESAVSNAVTQTKLSADQLRLKRIEVGEAATLKRIWARGRGQADHIDKRTCHIKVVLSESHQ